MWQQTLWTDGLEYYHVLQQRAPSGTGVVRHTVLLLLHSGHYSLIRPPTPAAAWSTSARGAWPASPRRPRGSATAPPSYREMAERTRKVPLPGPEKSLLRYRGKASAELAPLTCYADLEVYSTAAATCHPRS